ncbi:MAG: hemolysin family protein [Actinomycetota bacterium]
MTVALIVLLLFLAGFGAMAETAVSRMTLIRAHHLVQEKRSGSEILVKIVEDPAPFLNIDLLVVLVCHLTATALATGIAIRHYGSRGEAYAAIVMTLLIFVFFEVVPKTFTVQRTERAALIVARPLYYLGRALQPLARALIAIANGVMVLLPGHGLPRGPFVTEDEIRHMVDVAEEEDEIEEGERELIHSVFEFGDTIVREVMVPKPDMVMIRADSTLEEALEVILGAGYSRIPIYEDDTDNIVGLLYAKDLLRGMHESKRPPKIKPLARKPFFVPEQKKVAELLRDMQEQRTHMAIVIDEYGATAGLVTIEDLIEEIVGEIVDEYDSEEPLAETVGDRSLRVDGKLAIDEVNELLEVDLPHEEWDTVGGLVFSLIGRVPTVGETVAFDGLEFKTERVVGRRIAKVLITKVESEPQEPIES